MREYQINSKTLAIIPYGNKKSIVYEGKKKFLIDKRPSLIISHNCMFYGSNYESRVKNTENLTGYTYKSPILVREQGNIIFFPSSSPRLKSCHWICLNNVKNYYYTEEVTIVKFINNVEIELPTSYGIINNQILRATRLDSIIRKNRLVNR